MVSIPMGKNPFLTVTVDELEKNVAEATKRLQSVKDTQNWRKSLHHCVRCDSKLPDGYNHVECEVCRVKYRKIK
jgi:hypothetical protein